MGSDPVPFKMGRLWGAQRMLRYAQSRPRRRDSSFSLALPPLLIRLGIEELSVAPVQLPSVKYAIRKLDAAHCHAMVEDCLRHGETERITQRVHDVAKASRMDFRK